MSETVTQVNETTQLEANLQERINNMESGWK